MDDILLQSRLTTPIRTGAAALQSPQGAPKQDEAQARSFREVLEGLQIQNSGVTFSKHAASRLEQRNIQLSASSLDRLNEGVRIAREKGMNDTLIIVDDSAFVVNAGSNKVITSLSDLRGRAITNIDGTVIV
ncbi:MAG: flagellar protein [Subdoligranulum sp.]|nr:flagellar protein [Subdoligranulum sp.]